jgi:hypothetical protein
MTNGLVYRACIHRGDGQHLPGREMRITALVRIMRLRLHRRSSGLAVLDRIRYDDFYLAQIIIV